jgi:hypothetical protein
MDSIIHADSLSIQNETACQTVKLQALQLRTYRKAVLRI